MPPRNWALLAVTSAVIALVVAACEEPEDDASRLRTCGDGRCEPTDCETTVRCPDDCGTCVGTECDVVSAQGSCNQACESNCDCDTLAELCTATYGELPGRCIPVACVGCSDFVACQFSPNADGACTSVTCS